LLGIFVMPLRINESDVEYGSFRRPVDANVNVNLNLIDLL